MARAAEGQGGTLAVAGHGDAAAGHYQAAGPIALLVHPDCGALQDRDVVVQDGVLNDGVAADAGIVQITARFTRDQLSIRVPGDRMELRTRPPETMTPLLTMLLTARPTRSWSLCTNLAGGCAGARVRMGQRLL